MDDAQRTHRILSGRFIAGAALPYTDEHGITWSLDFADVKGITRRMVQAEATTRRLEKELAVAEQEREAWMKEWARKGDRADRAKAESRRLREALEELRECCNPPGVPNITVVRAIIDAALAGTEAS